MEQRQQVFKALVGSWNYNLQTNGSDMDYKVFHIPTFTDLYTGEMFHQQTITLTEDYDRHDIRKLPLLLWKANLSYLEALYSTKIETMVDDSCLDGIFYLKDQLMRMNLAHLYNSCIGQYKMKMKTLKKGTEGTQHLVDMHGYDTKQALHANRILDFIGRFFETDFDDFHKAIRYDDTERAEMLKIKDGKYSESEIIILNEEKFLTTETLYKKAYMSQKPDDKLKDYLDLLVKEMVRKNLTLGGF